MHELTPLHFYKFCLKFIQMHGLTPLHFSKFCPKIEKKHGQTPFQIKVKNQRDWTNHFTFLQILAKISKNA